MKILVRSMATSGEPLPDGREIRGNDSHEIVSIMRSQAPFTTSKPFAEYITDILCSVEGPQCKPLPDDPHQAATEFLSRLASQGLVEFLPDEDRTRYPERFFQVMEAIRRSGLTNMLDRKVVGQIAQEMGFDEIADWIKANRREYSEFILGGRFRFLSDTSPDQKGGAPCADK